MSFQRSKMILAIFLLNFCSFLANADEPTTTTKSPANDAVQQSESFETVCLTSWIKRLPEVQDKISYKNFGQKYCSCALNQPLDTDTEVDKAIRTCMPRTLLQESMDALEDGIGLDKAGAAEINQSCLDKWTLIYPQMSEEAKGYTTTFCSCSQPKLLDLIKISDNKTDKEYYAQIETIAASCSEMIKPSQPTAETKVEQPEN